MNILEEKGVLYYLLMGILAALCLLEIKNRRYHFWWWAYIGGGSYLLFDLFAMGG